MTHYYRSGTLSVRTLTLLVAVQLALLSCLSSPIRPEGNVSYVGSSTVAVFLRAAEPVYGAIRFDMDTGPESAGGEIAIRQRRTDMAGVARPPSPETLGSGIVATLIGRDAIAVIVNAKNPVQNLSREALQQIFSGKLSSWTSVGGPDLPVVPYIVAEESATREVFRRAVFGFDDYEGCEVVRPDQAIIDAVAKTPGAVGQISFSFLQGAAGVRPVAVDGEQPTVTNFDYPISRPLYLLWREGEPVIEAFVAWSQTTEGQRIVMQDFVGTRVVGSVRGAVEETPRGTLVVYTETYSVYDGGIYYYPHREYEILTQGGVLIRRVPNHRGENDESSTRIELEPGTYLIRTESSKRGSVEFFVTIDGGELTELDVQRLLEGGQ